MAKVGLIVGAFKPFTAGHDFVVQKAASENDKVLVFASTGDRKRKGEMPITWEQMKPIWDNYILPNLPGNVEIVFDKNPIGSVHDLLVAANDDPDNNITFTYYADDKDIGFIEQPRVRNKLFKLISNDQLESSPIKRADNIDVSGTMAREAIDSNNLALLRKILPPYLKKHTSEIMTSLQGVQQ